MTLIKHNIELEFEEREDWILCKPLPPSEWRAGGVSIINLAIYSITIYAEELVDHITVFTNVNVVREQVIP